MNLDLSPPEEIIQEKIFLDFCFHNAKMPYESYKGDYAGVRYFVKIIIISTVKNTEYEKEFAVVNPHNSSILQKNDEPIHLQVGMKNKLSLSIFFQHKNYNCRGTLKGFIAFNYINLNLKFMEVQIVRREIIFGDKKCEPAYVARYELIDGVPNKNEKIPVRFFLKSYNLTPTYPNIDNTFFVKYYLNLVIADDEDNRYFKQKEICLFRLYKERKNIYNPNNNNSINNYDYMNEYGEFNDNDEIFITEPIYEEDYFIQNKKMEYNNEQQGFGYNQNDEFYDDLTGINQILPKNNEDDDSYGRNRNNNRSNNNLNSQSKKREEFNQQNYKLMMMYMNNQNSNNNVIPRNNYDDFEEINNKYNNKKKSNNNNYNNNQYNSQNQRKNNKKIEKNEIIINNNPSNYHSIQTKDTKDSYNEDNMFEENLDYDDMNNIINDDDRYMKIKQNNNNDYSNNININNDNDININQQPIGNKNEIHHSHRSNLMQARISTEDDVKDIFNKLDKNTNKDELKKNIFG